MKRKILFISMFLYATGYLLSQNEASFTDVKGYYVTRYSKNEISVYFNEKIKKSKGVSFNTPIDFYKVSFFIPVQIGTKLIADDKKLPYLFLNENNLNKDSIYYLPIDDRKKKMIISQINENDDIDRGYCILSEADCFSPFYYFQEDQNYLFKIIYIEGSALIKTVNNVESERYKYGIDVYSTNKKSVMLNIFLITHIENYSTLVNIPKAFVWYPYL